MFKTYTSAGHSGSRLLVRASPPTRRVWVDGKFLRLDAQKLYIKGFAYGPFAQNSAGEFLPERSRAVEDLAHMARLGANALRVYQVPPPWLLDEALEHDIRVFVDVPWEKHRCFLEDWSSQQDALDRVRRAARELGSHPGLLAISVGNEVPKDVVRFYGARRIEQFLDRLIDVARQQAPDCLYTYTNYPSTEFLSPAGLDFYCANVYLHDPVVLGRYLDRLQHVAGHLPLVLGEYGLCSYREGETHQAEGLREHICEVFGRGLAGSFIFSYTDDWHTGGSQIEDWAFGVTRIDRTEKPAALALAEVWTDAPCVRKPACPKVSVVVCSYDGARTLEPCLHSLMRLDYPDFEVILVDDGSTDNTPQIASRFPDIRYIHQTNHGLSHARNVGALAARGEIVAYTDSDCVADESWLTYLVRAMQDQNVEVIGGPNIPPPEDSWAAKVVAASPGGPSHVMIDDRLAEHVPGCNMAFRRDKLIEVGLFDEQYRVAGDDVDICWRFIDRGYCIGYAASALVWHHRRNTLIEYLKQQKGYGRSEALLSFKHPRRLNAFGCLRWNGVIYGGGAVGLAPSDPLVYHGRFGTGLFQIIYRRNAFGPWSYFLLLEWHAIAILLVGLSIITPSLLVGGLAMWVASLMAMIRAAVGAQLPKSAPWWCRPAVGVMFLLQPIVRSLSQYHYRFGRRRLPETRATDRDLARHTKRVSGDIFDLYWSSPSGRGREQLLDALVRTANRTGWRGDFDGEWKLDDVDLFGDLWHDAQIRTATEELGGPKRFTRVRCTLNPTAPMRWLMLSLLVWCVAAVVTSHVLVELPVALASAATLFSAARSRRRCRRAIADLIWQAGHEAELEPVSVAATSSPVPLSRAERMIAPSLPELLRPVAASSQEAA